MKMSLSITDGAKYWGLFKSFEAIRILSLLYMFSKSKTLENTTIVTYSEKSMVL